MKYFDILFCFEYDFSCVIIWVCCYLFKLIDENDHNVSRLGSARRVPPAVHTYKYLWKCEKYKITFDKSRGIRLFNVID